MNERARFDNLYSTIISTKEPALDVGVECKEAARVRPRGTANGLSLQQGRDDLKKGHARTSFPA